MLELHSRRDFLKTSGALIAASFVAKDLLLPSTASADNSVEFSAALPFERFYYRPRNLKEVFEKFRDAHMNRTGEDIWENLNKYVEPTMKLTGTADGNCNGASNDEVLKPKMLTAGTLGGIDFSKNEIKILTSVLHYGDASLPERWKTRFFNPNESYSPLFIHTLLSNMKDFGWGFVVDISQKPDEMWSYPIDRAFISWKEIPNGYIRSEVLLSAPNYLDSINSSRETEQVRLVYEIEPNNPTNLGRFYSGEGKIVKSWRPDPEHFIPRYQVRGNVFNDEAVRSLEILADYSPV